MSHYLNQIEQLVALQKVDDLIHGVKKKLSAVPAQIETLQAEFNACDTNKKHIEEKLQHLHDQERRINNELEDNDARIKKSKEKLTQVENEREFNAVTREVDSMEKKTRSRTDEQQALEDELSLQSTNMEEANLEWNLLSEKLKEAKVNLEVLTKETDVELAKFATIREETTSHIPAPVLSRYEFIRKRLEHPVIVSVTNGICSGCHISIPPQAFNELQRGQQILSCPNCQRLIFWTEHFKKEENSENTKEN